MDFLRSSVGTYAEYEEDALPAPYHLHQLRCAQHLLLVGFTGGQNDLSQLWRESLPREGEGLKTSQICKLDEIVAMGPDTRGTCYEIRYLLGGPLVLRDGEPEKCQIHIERHGEVPRTGDDAPMRFPERLGVVSVIDAYRHPSSAAFVLESHFFTLGRATMA